MAVETMKFGTKMVLKLDGGLNEKGEPIVKSKTYANVNTAAADQDIYDVATTLAGLQTRTLEGVHKLEETILIQV
ncbi:DUF1659 domain-containing protein [Alkalibacter rhizosphaerae]|uniref:DUF1659 domain-containing protein n=1 Tax=Alkalibacter rhizosphaerae TaxID=2815577 RepID=A0A974XGJ7_9FIRM|nr:DUF1659 domain-containing protein [Alkalibacter rhizosphaerae]QSX09291.1 DUF1659 domain-containing protein [Alkalibacter rhizosphaerae]